MTLTFREKIAAHREAGTCYICGHQVDPAQGIHGVTGAHWDCAQNEERKTKAAIERVDGAFSSLGFKAKRKREGQGKTALRAKALAIEALESALQAKLEEVNLWNQQGAYRGPRWDLDTWGLDFRFQKDGHRFTGSASSLATMTQCVKAKRLHATPEGLAHSFSLWPAATPPKQSEFDQPSTQDLNP